MANREGGSKKKISSWLYSSRKDRSLDPRHSDHPESSNREGGKKAQLFSKAKTPVPEERSQQGQSGTQARAPQAVQQRSSPAAGQNQPPNANATSVEPLGDDEQGDPLESSSAPNNTSLPGAAEASPDEQFLYRVPAEAWREVEPSKELMLSVGQQHWDFCESASKEWARGKPLASNVFGNPIATAAQPTASSLLPPRLFDLLFNKTVSTKRFGETHYSIMSHAWGDTIDIDGQEFDVNWKIPVSSRGKLIQMLEFARIVGGERYVWVDILCLDQAESNEDEIARMKSYYSDSTVCLIWLDKASSQQQAEWDGVLDAIETFNGMFSLDKHGHPKITPKEMMEGGMMDISMNEQQAFLLSKKMASLEYAPWFKRVWTLQEAVMPEDLMMCTAEKYMISGAQLFSAISLCAMMVDPLLDVGSSASIAILNALQNSEVWKILRLRQLYRKRQVSFWHIVQAIKSRKCLKDQDRVLGTLGLIQGVDSPIDLSLSAEPLLKDLHAEYLKAGDFSALMFLSDQETVDYHRASRGFLVLGALATKRRETHRIIHLGDKRFRLQGVGIDSITSFYPILGQGKLVPWRKKYPEMLDVSSPLAVDVARAWDLDVDSFPEESRILLVFTVYGFGRSLEVFDKLFEAKGEPEQTQYYKSIQKSLITWSSVSTLMHQIENYAVVVIWTQCCGPVLAVLTEEPKQEACIVTPSSYVDEPGEGFLVLTADAGGTTFRKIGVGLSTKVKPRYLDTVTLGG